MSGLIWMLFLTLLPSLLVTPLLALRNVSSLTIVMLMRRLLIFSLLGLLLLLIFSDNEGIDWYFSLAIIWGIVFGVSYWIINKLTILILEKRDALYGTQLAALGIKWWEFKKWNAVRMYVRNSSEALARVREIRKINCSDDEKSEMMDALFPFDYYSKGVNPGWVGVIPAINVCENIYEVANIYKDLSLSNSKALGDVAWHDDGQTFETSPVTQKQPNELGLYDMSGNVWEWCQDWYINYGVELTPAMLKSAGMSHVTRGGSWNRAPRFCRVSVRGHSTPNERVNYVGLRVVMEIEGI